MKYIKLNRMQHYSRSDSILKNYIHMLSNLIFVIKLLSKTFAPLKIYLLLMQHSIVVPFKLNSGREIKNKFIKKIVNQSFTNDWFTNNISKWVYIFKICNVTKKDALKILEIGSYEGMSALFFMETFPRATLTCIDLWKKRSTEQKFEKNIKPYRRRIKKIRSNSLSFFANQKLCSYYDLIYIDGSHYADDVLTDALLSFNLLKRNGILIFDDYLWKFYSNAKNNPGAAINLFLKLKADSLKIIFVGYQIAIQKI